MAKQPNQAGYSLIEALVAVALISIGMLAMAGLAGVAVSGNFDSSQYTIANDLAVDKIEQIHDLAYSAVAEETEDFGSIEGYPRYRREVAVVEDVPLSLGPPPVYGQKTVTVTVTWRRNRGRVDGDIQLLTVVTGID
jgi:prepilin-type N-terminal cleavage/methylation domain-containing protein